MPPQENQPNPFGPTPDGSLPAPVNPEVAPPLPLPDIPAAPVAHVPPAGYTPTPIPQAGVPKLHPENIPQEYPAAETPKKEDNRYAFFMESKPKEKKTLLPKKSNKFAWLIIIAVGVLIILGITAAVISSSRNSKNKGNVDTFSGVITQQQEIIRVTKNASDTLQSTDLKNFNETTNITTIARQQELITYVANHGVKLNPKKIAAITPAGATTDKVLASAEAASVYDSTYKRVMLQLITDYQTTLERMSKQAQLQTEKTIVDKNLADAELLHNALVTE